MWKKVIVAVILLLVVVFGVNFLLEDLNSEEEAAIVTNCDSVHNALYYEHISDIYTKAGLDTAGLPLELFKKGITGYYNLLSEDKVDKPILSLIDFRMPSTDKRLWVIDLDSQKLLFHSLVAHGRGSGDDIANQFSNEPESYQSSIGFYITSTQYTGKHGLSLVLDGVEKGFNDNARDRSIVIHGADYVSKNFVESIGRLGRSHGCPAVPNEICEDLVCTICDHSALFIYYPLKNYDKKSHYLQPSRAIAEYVKKTPSPCPASGSLAHE